MKITNLETENLRIRGFLKSDALFAIGIWNDEEMGQYLADAAMKTIDPSYLKLIESLGEDKTCCYLISELKSTNEKIGTCSFIPSLNNESFDIAYCVHKKYQNKGYATEMVNALVLYAKDKGIQKVTATVDIENTASKRVMEKCGFQIIDQGMYLKRGKLENRLDYKYILYL